MFKVGKTFVLPSAMRPLASNLSQRLLGAMLSLQSQVLVALRLPLCQLMPLTSIANGLK
jgi:hypothetical protein